MKRNRSVKMTMAALSIGVLMGCSQDPASVDIDTDEDAMRYLMEVNEDYFADAGIDDEGAQPLEYSIDGFGKTADLITPLRFGRKGRLQLESFSVERLNDSLAVATIIKSFNGQFLILAEDSTDTIAAGKLYSKDMENEIVRQAIFKKVDNDRNRRKNWKLKRVSGTVAKSPETSLSFESVTVQNSDGQEWTIEEPLQFIRDLEAMPTFQHRDSVKVFVKVNNSSPYEDMPGETLALRYRSDKKMHRARKGLNDAGEYPDETAGDGVYSGFWLVGQRRGIYHAFVDAMDNATIYDDLLPYNSLIWGFPYLVK